MLRLGGEPIGNPGAYRLLHRQLIEQLLRGGCALHCFELTVVPTHVVHRRDPVDSGLIGLQLGVREFKRRQVGAMAVNGRCLLRQLGVNVAFGAVAAWRLSAAR